MSQERKILITGTTGRLGGALCQHYRARHSLLTPTRAELDLSQPAEICTFLDRLDFDLLIHAAAMGSPDACERQPELASRVNAESSQQLALHCESRGIPMIYISTDYVFGGHQDITLTESSIAEPVCHYGRTKRAAEIAVLETCSRALVARVSWLFGTAGSFPDQILSEAKAGQTVGGIGDKWSVPTSVHDIAHWLEQLWLLEAWDEKILHLCNSGRASWQTYAQEVCDQAWRAGLLSEPVCVQGSQLDDFTGFIAQRPRYTTMSNARLAHRLSVPIRSWQSALQQWLHGLVSVKNAR
jgi:dTDP-4-dehydrorhamnose reductase